MIRKKKMLSKGAIFCEPGANGGGGICGDGLSAQRWQPTRVPCRQALLQKPRPTPMTSSVVWYRARTAAGLGTARPHLHHLTTPGIVFLTPLACQARRRALLRYSPLRRLLQIGRSHV